MKNWKATLPIVLALIIAVAGTYFIYQWLGNKMTPKEIVRMEKAETIPVIVAAMDLPWGTKLTKEMLKSLPYLKESLPVGHYVNAADIENRVLIANIKQGEPLVDHRLAPTDIKTGGVSAVLPTGKRAVAVKGDKIIGISGFINPGNRVDVLVTFKNPQDKSEHTKIVLENINVLATGTQIEQNDKGEPAPVDVYTLEVTPEESEKLSLAATKGKLQFALRNIMDEDKVRTYGATIGQTLRSLTPRTAKKPKNYRPTSTTVEVIKGSQISKQRVKL